MKITTTTPEEREIRTAEYRVKLQETANKTKKVTKAIKSAKFSELKDVKWKANPFMIGDFHHLGMFWLMDTDKNKELASVYLDEEENKLRIDWS